MTYRIRALLVACLTCLGVLGATGTGSSATEQAALTCSANDLNVTLGEHYFASHTFWITTHIRAKPGVQCNLPAEHPTGLQFADADGAPLRTDAVPFDSGNPPMPVTVTEDAPAHFEIMMEAYALQQVVPDSLTFTLPGADLPSTISWPEGVQYEVHLSYCQVQPGLGSVTDYTC